MRAHIVEKLKKDLLELWLVEGFEISKIVCGNIREPLTDDIAETWINESITQTHKILSCLKILENSSEFQDFIEKLETRLPQLANTAWEKPQAQTRNNLFHTPKYNSAQIKKGFEILNNLLESWIFNLDDLHSKSGIFNMCDWDKFDESDFRFSGFYPK